MIIIYESFQDLIFKLIIKLAKQESVIIVENLIKKKSLSFLIDRLVVQVVVLINDYVTTN